MAELRRGEEGADGLVGGAGVAEAVQPQHEAPVAGRHGAGEAGRRSEAARREAAAMAAATEKRKRTRLLMGHMGRAGPKYLVSLCACARNGASKFVKHPS